MPAYWPSKGGGIAGVVGARRGITVKWNAKFVGAWHRHRIVGFVRRRKSDFHPKSTK